MSEVNDGASIMLSVVTRRDKTNPRATIHDNVTELSGRQPLYLRQSLHSQPRASGGHGTRQHRLRAADRPAGGPPVGLAQGAWLGVSFHGAQARRFQWLQHGQTKRRA
jgi:hypothetical protein